MANSRKNNCRRGGFSLVELLVVVAIIVLLIGLLIPGLTAVRNQAKIASSKATFASLDAGMATYKADQEVGGAFPPSRGDNPNGVAYSNAAAWDFANPYDTSPNTLLHDYEGATGAALLVMAMAGADLQGTPGFRDLDGDGVWGNDCFGGGAAPTGNPPGAYAAKAANNQAPYYKRFGPYVQIDKIKITPRTPGTTGAATTFDIKGATLPAPLKLPVFLDAFGYPILYYHADTTANRAVTDIGALNQGFGTYMFEDNRYFTGDDGDANYGVDLGAGKDHAIVKAVPNNYNSMKTPNNFTLPQDRETFLWYTHDPKVTTNIRPRNAKTYLMMSPGPDAIYGTADDVANFDKNF